jgi:hypothetical protein
MKALLINPIEKTIEEVEYNGDYKQIYKYIDASPFGVVDIPNDDTIYIDDEGLLGADHDSGDSTSVHATRKELKHRITFIGEQRVDHSKLGFTIETIN